MMAEPANRRDPEFAADLLGYHLGIADQETRARVEAAFGNAEALAAARATMQKFLAPLDADQAPAPPPDLVQTILDRVEENRNILPMRRPTPAKPPPLRRAAERSSGGGPPLVMRDVVGLAAAILIFVGIFVPGYRSARQAALRTACANNLRLIGNGYVSYAEAHASGWPYAGALPVGVPWIRTGKAGLSSSGNSRHGFRLLSGRFARPSDYICPAREGDFALNTRVLAGLDDFPDPRNNSYATNFVTRPLKRGEFVEETPIAADMTPLVDQQRRLKPQGTASPNSDSHGRSRGQNVLRATLNVRFFRTPNAGISEDDIYRLLGVEHYTGLERPTLQGDAFLVP